MTTIDARTLAERVAESMYARDAASQGLGIRIAHIGPGFAELAMAVRADMLNGHEICHGGFIFTLADSAFAYACNSYNLNTVAVGLRDRVHGAARAGDVLTARAHERQLAGRTGVYDVEVANQRGETVALFARSGADRELWTVGSSRQGYRIKGHADEHTAAAGRTLVRQFTEAPCRQETGAG